jgi:hypothetical protein
MRGRVEPSPESTAHRWPRHTKPKTHGLVALAYWPRWHWLEHCDRSRTVLHLMFKEDVVSKAFLNALIRCNVRDGATILFWEDTWLNGQCISVQALDLVAMMFGHC